jgi:two-component system, chemotaxis family, sensor kinase CheA
VNLEDAIQTLAQECAELLDAMENALLRLEHVPTDTDLINEVFRAAHTIKGSAGLFGFDGVVQFAHHVESVLDRVREGSLAIDEELTALLLACCDHLGVLTRAATTGQPDTEHTRSAELSARLAQRLGPARSAAPPAAAHNTLSPAGAPPAASLAVWQIQLAFGRDVLRNGMDPLAFLRYLARLGEIRQIATRLTAPPAHEVDPESCYLGFEIRFESAATRAAIAQVFEFVQDDCDIRIELEPSDFPGGASGATEGPAPSASRPLPALDSLPELDAPRAAASATEAAPRETEARSDSRARDGRLIRVDADKLDQLIDLVGELVIAGAGNRLHAERAGAASLIEAASGVSRLVEEVRNATLGLRMVQIGATFQRFHRVVRDVSHELGKDIALVIEGAETELDKSMVEKLGDPLLHLVRNAMDHGIEPVERRLQAGKQERGLLRLNAYHDSGSVVVEVSDDGGGLHRDRILDKAIERGLVARDQQLTDREVFALIFEAGFSTADKISNLSGRGVGMDVVRSAIEALRGTVELESQPGRGTTVRLRLPLTLAIIEGFLVRTGPVHYVIPLEMVVECLGFNPHDRRSAEDRGFINVRDMAMPIVRLADHFALRSERSARENVVVVKGATGHVAGLVVDELMGELQTVIKPLGKLFSQVRGISGTALLGSGDVALILDVNMLVSELLRSNDKQRRTSGAAVTRAAN